MKNNKQYLIKILFTFSVAFLVNTKTIFANDFVTMNENEISKLKNEITELKNDLSKENLNNFLIQTNLDKTNSEINNLKIKISKLNDEIKDLETLYNTKKSAIETLKTNMNNDAIGVSETINHFTEEMIRDEEKIEDMKIQLEKLKENKYTAENILNNYNNEKSNSIKKTSEIEDKISNINNEIKIKEEEVNNFGIKDLSKVTMDGTIPNGYYLEKNINTSNYTDATYPWGQCTWWTYNRAAEFGIHYSPFMGNGGDWDLAGYPVTNVPTEHVAVSIESGQLGVAIGYGHVMFVEQIREDGSILVSDTNGTNGLGGISYSIIDSETAKTLDYILPK